MDTYAEVIRLKSHPFSSLVIMRYAFVSISLLHTSLSAAEKNYNDAVVFRANPLRETTDKAAYQKLFETAKHLDTNKPGPESAAGVSAKHVNTDKLGVDSLSGIVESDGISGVSAKHVNTDKLGVDSLSGLMKAAGNRWESISRKMKALVEDPWGQLTKKAMSLCRNLFAKRFNGVFCRSRSGRFLRVLILSSCFTLHHSTKKSQRDR
jgi:hypothetical protein